MASMPPTEFRREMQRRPPIYPAQESKEGSRDGVVQAGASVEAGIRKLEARLEDLTAQVRQAQQLASLGTAAAMIAHEVNNFLTPMRSWAQAALESGDAELQRKALEVVLNNACILGAMSERVLTLGAAKAVTQEAVCIRVAAEDAAASLCRDPSKDGIVFRIDTEEAAVALADPLQVRQILFNLLLNARNALAPRRRGRLTVSARRHGDWIITTVADDGPGIAARVLPHVFDPLWTSKSKTDDQPKRCAGLGLALCRDLVEAHGGTISVESEPERGTTFTIKLPAAKECEKGHSHQQIL